MDADTEDRQKWWPRTARMDGHAKPSAEMGKAYKGYVLALMVAVYAFSYLDRTLAGTLAPLIKADLNLTDTQLGLVNGTSFAIMYGLATLPFGWLADRYNRARIISGALAFWSASTALFGLGSSAIQVMMARAGVGFGEAAGASTSHSIVTDYFPYSQRARALAIYGFGAPIGVAVGAIVGGWISAMVGWRAAFLAAGGAGLLLALLFKLTVREPTRIVLEGESSAPEPFLRGIAIMLGKPGYVLMCAGISLGFFAGQAKTFWIPSYLVRSFGLDASQVSMWFGVIQFVGGLSGAVIGGVISDRLARRDSRAPALVTGAAFLATAPIMLMMFVTTDTRIALACLFLGTTTVSLANGPIPAAIQYFAAPSLRGTASAIMTFFLLVFTVALGVPLIGMLSDALARSYGHESLRYALLTLPIFYVGGGLSALAAGRWMRMGPSEREKIG